MYARHMTYIDIEIWWKIMEDKEYRSINGWLEPPNFSSSSGMTRDDHPNVSDQLYANYAIGQAVKD